ncbi:MAG: hypothetical protein MJZ06_01995 [Bacteroidaceae bacterium]|nr:hypothetical protein [Bacteroidaceae bacterium]
MKKCTFLLAALFMLAFSACDKKEEYAYPAQFGKIFATQDVIYPGDTVILQVEVIDPGHRIYKGEYTWKNDAGFKETVKTLAAGNDKTILAPPQVKWVPKRSGKYKFSMEALFRYSMPDINGQMVSGAAAKPATSTITVIPRPKE